MYEPFWAAAEDLDISIGFHEGGEQRHADRSASTGSKAAAPGTSSSHTMEMMLACLAVIWGGVCEKHPKIRIGFLESGGGWIAPWLDRMDRHFDDQGFNDSRVEDAAERTVPAQLLDLVRAGRGQLKVLADYIGPHKIMWATDYPHPDGFFPGAPDMVRERLKALSPETKRQVMAGGAMGFYGLS